MYRNVPPSTRNQSPFAPLLAKAKREGTPDARFGKRRQPRFALGAALTATLVGGTEPPWPVTMQNISEGGIAIKSDRPMARGKTLHLSASADAGPESTADVEVMHCTATDDGYLIGVRFSDETGQP